MLCAGEKFIRLRNETIRTERPVNNQPKNAIDSSDAPVSGLFLIQFTGSIQPEWQQELVTRQITLLRYVPDHSFIARLNKVRPAEIESLPFVQWIGPYRAEHKVHKNVPRGGHARGVVENDLPIKVLLTPDAKAQDLAKLRGSFRKVNRESAPRFGRIIEGTVTPVQLDGLADSDSVLWIEPARPMKLFDEIATKIVAGDDGLAGTFATVHELGFTGAGVTVAVADSGLHLGAGEDMHPDLDGRVDAFFHYGDLFDASDEHSHGTHVTGIVAGDGATGEVDAEGYLYGLGVAPEAHIVAQRIFDGDGGYQPPTTFETMTRDAVRAGADIGSNSWGDDTQGRYDLSAAEFDELVRDADAGTANDQPYILEFSAGNAGPGEQTIGSPAVAKNVIATGAAENNRVEFFLYDSGQETMADFSSRGPCDDGRIKPDVTAPGTWIASLRSALANDEYAWAPISENYLYQGGTSQAGPQVSGAAAVFVQYYLETVTNNMPSPALVKAALINSAIDMDESGGTTAVPNNDEGWGRIDLVEIIDSPLQFEFVDQSVILTNAEMFEKRVLVASADEMLKVTLAYTDEPGFPGAIPALVNDLDLEVIAPNGNTFHGNQFEAGESVPNAPGFDNINNVEGVHLAAPVPGEYIIRVRARNVVADARRDVPGIGQDFALVVSAAIAPPGTGILFFDKSAYSAPATAQLKLVDPGLSGQPSVSVLVRSTTETNGETFVLTNTGTVGVFTGAVMTATGGVAVDGKIQVLHGNQMEAIYQDASPPSTRVATARIDLLPPLITNVSITNRFGRMIISWETDELADSRVRFGTNTSVSTSVTNARFVLNHVIGLENLIAGQTYYCLLISADEAGNAATNNNNGALFSFVAAPPAPILLVDSYTDQFFSIPPLSGYTDALDEIGVAYEVWDVPSVGSPTFDDLKPFDAVIWRVPEFQNVALTASERTAVTNYLAHGGALLIASMEATSRFDESGAGSFRTNVLHVLEYGVDEQVPAIVGAVSEPITSGIDTQLDYTPYEDDFKEFAMIPTDLSDTLTISSNAAPILFDDLGQTVGLRYPRVGQDSLSRVVFLSFPLDAVPMTGPEPSNRPNLLRNLIEFLIPGANGFGAITLDNSVYTIPSRVTIEVADSDLQGTGQIAVTCFSDTATNGQSVTLNETVRPGLFRGFVTLVAHTNAIQPGELRVQETDTVWVEYFDNSASSTARALAQIDTVPPAITSVLDEAGYTEAEVTWDTSKPCDGLVQFGESPLLGRTAYHSALTDSHALKLGGLQADRVYFYRVVSRDQAGNTTINDNGGELHTFRTLTPFPMPWFDNLEGSQTNWIVLNGEVSAASWQLGTPANGLETAAYSGTNSWGSNLEGDFIDVGDTTLAGPAIALDQSPAFLRFWHSYDFRQQSEFDIAEGGEVYISIDDGNTWTFLKSFEDSSFGWEEARIDLTPYAGQVIRLGFYYGLFTFENANHPGWLIDDLSITTDRFIQITNNISQAQFTLSGPISRSGSGLNTIVTNAPGGQYVLTFLPVPFYTTPPAQTNTLTSFELVFEGNYEFPDTNANGMSDLWEQQFFGSVSTNRTEATDSDGDGMSDFAEFAAGTNPTNPASTLSLIPELLTNGTVRLEWSAVPDRAYLLQSSSDAITWTPLTSWMEATTTNVSFAVPLQYNGTANLFRLQVRP